MLTFPNIALHTQIFISFFNYTSNIPHYSFCLCDRNPSLYLISTVHCSTFAFILLTITKSSIMEINKLFILDEDFNLLP